MADYRTIKMSFWTDPYIEGLEPEMKLLYLYLFTNPYTSSIGVCNVTQRKIAFETGLDAKTVERGVTKLFDDGKILVDGSEILLVHFLKHQAFSLKSEKTIPMLQGLFQKIDSVYLRDALCVEHPDIFSSIHEISIDIGVENNDTDTISIPYRYPSLIKIKLKDKLKLKLKESENATVSIPYRYDIASKKPKAEKRDKSLSPSLPEKYIDFVRDYQTQQLQERGNVAPKVTDDLIRTCALEVDKAIRIDGFDFDELQNAIRWAQKDEFWGKNLISLAQIRKKGSNGLLKIQNIVNQYRESLVQKIPKQGSFMTKGEQREYNNRLAAERAEAMMEEQRRRFSNG